MTLKVMTRVCVAAPWIQGRFHTPLKGNLSHRVNALGRARLASTSAPASWDSMKHLKLVVSLSQPFYAPERCMGAYGAMMDAKDPVAYVLDHFKNTPSSAIPIFKKVKGPSQRWCYCGTTSDLFDLEIKDILNGRYDRGLTSEGREMLIVNGLVGTFNHLRSKGKPTTAL
jgi:hypothetical protein